MRRVIIGLAFIGAFFVIGAVQADRWSDRIEELAVAAIVFGLAIVLYRRLPKPEENTARQ